MLTVAIATESESFDAEAYRALLSRLLDEEVTRWKTDLRFSGWRVRPELLGSLGP